MQTDPQAYALRVCMFSPSHKADFFDVSVDYLIGKDDYYPSANPGVTLNDKKRRMLALFDEHDEEYQNALIRLLESEK